ncbi:MAG: RNA polymerase sporulation sigma factor SigK [Clostridia bacterium]|nr:RNA polymerase sporulation sigma factor SigK [Clostridia bacterium]
MFWQILEMIWGKMLFLILHVSNTGAFPRPLTAKEEQEYLDKMLNEGDKNAREKLIEHNLRLVAHIIKKYYSAGYDQDDLISIGTIGLIKAISSFDNTKKTRLATYAARCIENEVLMYFRSQRKTAQDISMSDPIDTDKDGNALTLIDVIADDIDIIEDIDTKMKCKRLRKYLNECLDERERSIIEYRYGLNGKPELTQREVAQKLNISRSYVSRIEKKALSILYEKFNK